jgi:hypothetical protein
MPLENNKEIGAWDSILDRQPPPGTEVKAKAWRPIPDHINQCSWVVRVDRIPEALAALLERIKHILYENQNVRGPNEIEDMVGVLVEEFPCLKPVWTPRTVLRGNFKADLKDGAMPSMSAFLTLMAMAKLVGIRVVIVTPVPGKPDHWSTLLDTGIPPLSMSASSHASWEESMFSRARGQERFSNSKLSLKSSVNTEVHYIETDEPVWMDVLGQWIPFALHDRIVSTKVDTKFLGSPATGLEEKPAP